MTALTQLLAHYPELRGTEATSATPLTPLWAGEPREIERAVAKRRWEFQAGRHCARRALEQLGIEPVALPRLESGAPRWPVGIAGSITHTGRDESAWAAAVVGHQDYSRSIGLDAERRRSFSPRLAEHILTPHEAAAAQALGASEREQFVLSCFSAKESAYKAQVALTGRYLAFADVEIAWDPLPSYLQEGRFSAELVGYRDAPDDVRCLEGRYLLGHELVLSLVVVPANAGSR